MQKFEKILDEFKERASSKNRYIYTAGADFTRTDGDPFFIEVPSGGGSVKYTTEGGQTNTETMSEGYHPTSFTKIFSTTAINLVIVW
jgi:hypothetical protein